ncbi:MAG: cytochrome c oxidase subunit II [Armatimonadetes bacterium]|nr:cytochrome c oxidase subunit II [Armatimonadota bacterium]
MNIPLLPEQASSFAVEVDAIYFVLWALTILFSFVVMAAIGFLAFRYRRGARVDRSRPVHSDLRIELIWSIVPLVIGLVVFAWSAHLYARTRIPPADSMEIYVIGKQWMWQMQHANGVRENAELHIPVRRNIKLTMISQDVIHSFYVPAFRVKHDVLPGAYTELWFKPTRVGRYRLYCSQYCGTQHSQMDGWVTVMEPDDFEKWLAEGGSEIAPSAGLVEAGRKLFDQMACGSCHGNTARTGAVPPEQRGGSLNGLYGSMVRLKGGRQVKADEAYLRESILRPNEKIVDGYWPIMPSYEGQLTEEQVIQLIAYMKTLGKADAGRGAGASPATSVPLVPLVPSEPSSPRRLARQEGSAQ